MGHLSARIAQRHSVPTTPILWRVARRKRYSPASKLELVEAAVIEVSTMGAAIVCPEEWFAPLGARVEVRFGDTSGEVVVRRAKPFPRLEHLILHGAEFADAPSALSTALYEGLVDPALRGQSVG